MPEFANKTNNVFNNVTSVETPGSIDDVIQILERADESGANVRAVGSNWSLSDVAQTNDVWIDLKENMGGVKELKAGDIHIGETEILSNIIPSIQTPASGLHISVPYRSYVYLEGGATVKGVYSELEDLAVDPEAGDGSLIPGAWALWGTGASSGQTIVGAFSTGTHGGDYRLPPIADMVRALRVITAGGKHLWIEPASRPLTEDKTRLAAMLGLTKTSIMHDDALFYSMLVSMGCMGVIVESVIELPMGGVNFGLSQVTHRTTWRTIKNVLIDGPEQLDRHLGITHPATFERTGDHEGEDGNAVPLSWAFEIYLSPFRIDDDYSRDSSLDAEGDRDCVVVSRAIAVGSMLEKHRLSSHVHPDAGLDETGLAIDVNFHGADRYRSRVNEIMDGARSNTDGYKYYRSVIETYDGSGELSPGLTSTLVIPTTNGQHVQFIDRLLSHYDVMIGMHDRKFAGFMSLRFTKKSRALLAMESSYGLSEDDADAYDCHIEMLSLKEINLLDALGDTITHGREPGIELTGHMEGPNDWYLMYWEQLALRHGGRMHWGQLNQLDRTWCEQSYPNGYFKWREQKTLLLSGGRRDPFRNDFSRRCGLHSNDEVVASCQVSVNGLNVFQYDSPGNLWHAFKSDADWVWQNLGLPGAAGERIVGGLTAVTTSSDGMHVFGKGNSQFIYQYTCSGDPSNRASWSTNRILLEGSNEEAFVGQIVALSQGGDSVDIFGVGTHGNLMHLSSPDGRRFRMRRHRVGFPGGHQLRGSITGFWGESRVYRLYALSTTNAILEVVVDGTSITGDSFTATIERWADYDIHDNGFCAPPAALPASGGAVVRLYGMNVDRNLYIVSKLGGRYRPQDLSIDADHYAHEMGVSLGHFFRKRGNHHIGDGQYRFEHVVREEVFLGPISASMDGSYGTHLVGMGESGGIFHAHQMARRGAGWSVEKLPERAD